MDPNDGFAYNKDAFINEYGGLDEWESAAHATDPKLTDATLSTPAARRQSVGATLPVERSTYNGEYRVDPNDGFAYNKDAFLEEYGGTDEWEAASPATDPSLVDTSLKTPAIRRASMALVGSSLSSLAASMASISEVGSDEAPLDLVESAEPVELERDEVEGEGGEEGVGAEDAFVPVEPPRREYRSLEEEYRIDNADGIARTLEEFTAKYGGEAEWAEAPPRRMPPEVFRAMVTAKPALRMGLDEEYRTDPKDGDVFVRADFVRR